MKWRGKIIYNRAAIARRLLQEREYSHNGMPRCGVTGNRGRHSRADSLRLIRSVGSFDRRRLRGVRGRRGYVLMGGAMTLAEARAWLGPEVLAIA
jgi:hypothetical protein